MGIFKMKPTRSEAMDRQQGLEDDIILDLDRLSPKRLAFQLHGKTHYLKPLTMQDMLDSTRELKGIDQAYAKHGKVKDDQLYRGLIDAYTRVFQKLSDSITRDDVERMSREQLARLFMLCLKHLTGGEVDDLLSAPPKLEQDAEKKKTITE